LACPCGFIAAALFFEALPASAQIAAPTTNLIERVLMVESQIKEANRTVSGTIFSFDLDDREYWLTAKHMLTGAKKPPYGSVPEHSVTLAILTPDVHERQWIPVNFTVLDPGKDIDIVVLAAPKPLMATAGTVMPLSGSVSYTLGGDCEFLGYPAVVNGAWQATLEGGRTYWMPFIKHCTISAGTSGAVKIIFLDGINNEGFSGGPVIYKTGNEQAIIGVISGYYHERADVVALVEAQGSNDITPTPIVPPVVAQVNSGFFIATSISHAVDAIRSNPIGPLRTAR
jgi:hypothetical protein